MTFTSQQKECIEEFLEATQSYPSMATTLLEKADFDIGTAIGYFQSSKFKTLKKSCVQADQPLIDIFNKYKDPDTGKIEIEGTIKYLSDLDIDPEEPVALYLAYLLDSPSTGIFELIYFVIGWSSIDVTTLIEMQSKLLGLKDALFGPLETLEKDDELNYTFKSVYNFTFQYILNSNNTPLSKKLDYEDCILYWDLLLKAKYPKEIAIWNEFIKDEYKKPINKDAWSMLLVFLNDFHNDPKLDNYDEMASWPLLIDSFVEYFKEHKGN